MAAARLLLTVVADGVLWKSFRQRLLDFCRVLVSRGPAAVTSCRSE
jgi:hypothetical protein